MFGFANGQMDVLAQLKQYSSIEETPVEIVQIPVIAQEHSMESGEKWTVYSAIRVHTLCQVRPIDLAPQSC